MPRYVLTTDAEEDITHIARYTAENWGPNQAIRYITGLQNCCKNIELTLAKSWSDIDPNLRSVRYESHVVFFLDDDPETLVIIAVFHQRMDFLARLSARF